MFQLKLVIDTMKQGVRRLYWAAESASVLFYLLSGFTQKKLYLTPSMNETSRGSKQWRVDHLRESSRSEWPIQVGEI